MTQLTCWGGYANRIIAGDMMGRKRRFCPSNVKCGFSGSNIKNLRVRIKIYISRHQPSEPHISTTKGPKEPPKTKIHRDANLSNSSPYSSHRSASIALRLGYLRLTKIDYRHMSWTDLDLHHGYNHKEK